MQKFQVQVEQVSANEAAMLRALRVIGKMTLANASRLHRYLAQTPSVVAAGIERAVAEHIAAQLSSAGARARVEPSSLQAPMVLEPRAGEEYQWGSPRTLRKKPD
jgi:ribosomal protein L7/L12